MDSFIYSGKIIKRLLGAKPFAKHWESTLTKIVTTFQSSQEDRHRTEQAITIKCGELVDRTLADAPSPGIRKSLGEGEGARHCKEWGLEVGGTWGRVWTSQLEGCAQTELGRDEDTCVFEELQEVQKCLLSEGRCRRWGGGR